MYFFSDKFFRYKVIIAVIIQVLSISCSIDKSPLYPNQPILIDGKFPEQLDADVAHAVLKPDGTLWTWGRNWSGQLGDSTLKSRSIPQRVKNIKNIVTFKLREGAAVAADIYGNIWYWGDRVIYLFSGVEETIKTPEKISKLPGTISIEIRGSTINLLRNDGTVWRLDWVPREPGKYIKPEIIPHLNNIKVISGHLALKNNGTICLLDDEWIKPGSGGYIPSIKNVKALQNRWKTHTVILKTDGTVWAWGRNKSGTCGDGTFKNKSSPVQVKNLSDIIAISANGARCLALKNDGTVWYWGLIDLDLDESVDIAKNLPTMIENLSDVTYIFAAAAVESLVKRKDNTYWMFNFRDLILYKVPFGE